MSAEAVAFLDQIRAFFQGSPGELGPPGPTGGAFPSGYTDPGHFGAGWSTYKAARDSISTRMRTQPKPSGAKLVSTEALPAAGYNSRSYCGVVRMADAGSYFLVPFARSTPYIYRERTGRFVPCPTIPDVIMAGQNGGALLPSGRVVMSPYQNPTLYAYNPHTGLLQVLQSGLTGTYKWSGVCVTVGGLAVFTPHNRKHVGLYDEAAGWSVGPTLSIVDYAYGGAGIPLPDGKVLFIPFNETRAAIFDPATGLTSFGAAIFPGAENFFGGRLIDEARAVFYPHKNDRPVIYDFVADTITPFPVATGTTGVANFNGGVRLADDRDFLIPYISAGARIIDVHNGTAITPPGTYGIEGPGAGACKGGCLMDSGDVLMAPFDSDNPLFAATGTGLRLDPEMTTSPHTNRN